MKKFLSLLLACLMVLSLAACGGKENDAGTKRGSSHEHTAGVSEPSDSSEPAVADPEPEVTAEDLISTGYGVDIGVPKSAALKLDFKVQEGSLSRTISCVHEHDAFYDHMTVTSQFDQDGTEIPMEYEFYYSYADSTVYQSSNGEVVAGVADGFECGITKVITTPVAEMVSNPTLEMTSKEYLVSGKFPFELFNGMLGFVYDDAATFTEDVDVQFIYSKGTNELVCIIWNATADGTDYIVTANVSGVNSTEVTFDVSSPSSNTADDSSSCRDGETLIAMTLYNTDFLYEEDVVEALSEKYPWADDDVVFQYRYFCNFYSKEGFVRRLSDSYIATESEQIAAVIMCKALGVPAENLWQNGYMPQELAEEYWNK